MVDLMELIDTLHVCACCGGLQGSRAEAPRCRLCERSDRMEGPYAWFTDFEAVVAAWCCLRCGVVAVACIGERPEVRP